MISQRYAWIIIFKYWTYPYQGNNWGKCEDGITAAVGCGPQETFRGCADIEIVSHPLLSALSGSSDDSIRLKEVSFQDL